MSPGCFLSLHEFERFLEWKPDALKDIVFELRNLIVDIAPNATEKIQWKGLSYYDASRGGVVKGGICQIELHDKHVRLSFIHGAFIQDPHGLLRGDRLSKRYVRLESYESVPWEQLADLVRVAAKFDPLAFWKSRET